MKEVVLKTEKLCKSYIMGKQGVHVLKNIDLELYKGDFTIIMGSSGSGKSTLLYSVSTMDRPTSGKVTLLGEEIQEMMPKQAAKIRKEKIAFIFQGINLIPDMTAMENVCYNGYGKQGRTKAEVKEEAERLMQKLGLSELKDHYPSEMSGGQQQRVAVARALISGAEILFGDEPTGALNSSSGRELLDLLTDLNAQGHTIVMVTHDLKAARRASRLLYLEDGKINGDLQLGLYKKEDDSKRAKLVTEFLQERGY